MCYFFQRYKMNAIVNTYLLIGDKFTAEMHFQDLHTLPVALLQKAKEEYQNLKK